MSGHTPGPWLRIDKADYAEIHAQFRPSSQAVALVGKPEDADLIAAAPALLEACQKMDAFWGADFEPPHSDPAQQEPRILSDDTLEVWRAIRAAISLTKGSEPHA